MIGYEDMTKAWWLTPWHGTDQRHQSAPRGGRRLATPRRGPLADHRCDACTSGRDCEAWLAQSARARAMPDFCPNKPAIEALVA